MSLPTKAIDRLFERLGATYGDAWTRKWADVPISDVKAAWSHELSSYSDRLAAVAWALENLPERCPNAIEFRNLCRLAPMPEPQKLPEPKADPQRLRAELAKLEQVRIKAKSAGVDHKAWARRICARSDAGERIMPITLQFARQALRKNLVAEDAE